MIIKNLIHEPSPLGNVIWMCVFIAVKPDHSMHSEYMPEELRGAAGIPHSLRRTVESAFG